MTRSSMPLTLMSIWRAVMPSRRAGDLEVHVADRVLLAEDVGQDHEVAGLAVEHEAHRRAGDGRLDRHARVHQGEGRAAGRGHRRRAVAGDHLGDEADDVRELLLRREHRQQRPLGEVAVADVAPAGAAHGLVLAGAVGREVVVVEVALLGLGADRVDPLDVRGRAERGDRQGLGLAAGEQAGAVRTRQQADLDRDRADLVGVAAVHADALVEDELADDLLVHEPEQALAEARLAAGGLEQLRRTRPCRVRVARTAVGDAGLEVVDAAGQVVAEADQQRRGRLGVRQGAVARLELDAEEARPASPSL